MMLTLKLNRAALLLAASTFLLLLVGGVVHGTGSGLACPDWPLCFGQVLPKMEGHVLYEHTHRLVAGAVALLTLGVMVAVLVARRGERPLVRLAVLAAALVLVQATLGGLTVLLKLPAIVSSAHLGVSMLFFVTTLVLVTRTDGSWRGAVRVVPARDRRLIGVTLAAVYLQILLGGVVRHTGAGLACVDFPLCAGSILPLGAHPTVIVQAVHRLVAVLVALAVFWTAARLWRERGASRLLAALAVALPLLVVAQITLGALSVLSFLELYRVTAHLGVAALLLAAMTLAWLGTARAGAAATAASLLPRLAPRACGADGASPARASTATGTAPAGPRA